MVLLVLLAVAVAVSLFILAKYIISLKKRKIASEVVTYLEVGTSRETIIRLMKGKGYSPFLVRSVLDSIYRIIEARKNQGEPDSPPPENPVTSSSQSQNGSQN